jgi:hypothetical protein
MLVQASFNLLCSYNFERKVYIVRVPDPIYVKEKHFKHKHEALEFVLRVVKDNFEILDYDGTEKVTVQ